MVCSHCGKPGHTKEKCFKLIGCSTHWEECRTCFKSNETGNIARDCPKNDENSNCDKKESNTDINGIFIVTVICEPCDEEGAKIIKER